MQRHQDSLIQPDPAIHRSLCPMQLAFQICELALPDAKVFQLFFRVRVRVLHEKILMDNADFNATAITTLMDGNHAAFADAVAHVSQYVSHFFPAGSNSLSVCEPMCHQRVLPRLHRRRRVRNIFIMESRLLTSPENFLVMNG